MLYSYRIDVQSSPYGYAVQPSGLCNYYLYTGDLTICFSVKTGRREQNESWRWLLGDWTINHFVKERDRLNVYCAAATRIFDDRTYILDYRVRTMDSNDRETVVQECVMLESDTQTTIHSHLNPHSKICLRPDPIHAPIILDQSCPWIESTGGLGWVRSRFSVFTGLGWSGQKCRKYENMGIILNWSKTSSSEWHTDSSA